MRQMTGMENSTTPAHKRTHRSPDQWREIIAEHVEGGGTVAALAARLGCRPSTVELHMRNLRQPGSRTRGAASKFIEVQSSMAPQLADSRDVLRLQASNGVIATFSALPSPEYLVAALGLG
jgi:transposase-like protein